MGRGGSGAPAGSAVPAPAALQTQERRWAPLRLRSGRLGSLL